MLASDVKITVRSPSKELSIKEKSMEMTYGEIAMASAVALVFLGAFLTATGLTEAKHSTGSKNK